MKMRSFWDIVLPSLVEADILYVLVATFIRVMSHCPEDGGIVLL
jgi:hypothetical protein